MSGDSNTNRTKVFLKASSKEEAVLFMLKTQKVNNMVYNFEGPTLDGKDYVCWYYADITRELDHNGDPLINILEAFK